MCKKTSGTTREEIAQISKVIGGVNEIVGTIATAVEEQTAATKRDRQQHLPGKPGYPGGQRERHPEFRSRLGYNQGYYRGLSFGGEYRRRQQ